MVGKWPTSINFYSYKGKAGVVWIQKNPNVSKKAALYITSESVIGTTFLEGNSALPRDLKLFIPFDRVITFLGIYHKEIM